MRTMKLSNPRAQGLFDSIKTFAENVPVYNLAKDLRAAGIAVSRETPDERMMTNQVGTLLQELAAMEAAEQEAAAQEAASTPNADWVETLPVHEIPSEDMPTEA